MKPSPLLLLALVLTSCGSPSPTAADSMQLYSPDTLELPAGSKVKTRHGLYQSQTDEVWYSADLYLKRSREALRP